MKSTSTTVKELRDWLKDMDDDDGLGIDDGGLSLQNIFTGDYYEVGGISDSEDEE